MPIVSVIISSYNHEKFIRKTIDSVLDQTFQDFEILVADDASTDNTLQVLKSIDDPRIHIFEFSENRTHHMKNECLDRANGKYIAILNSDDYMMPTRLEEQVKFLDRNDEFLAVLSDYNAVTEDDQFIETKSVQNRSRHELLRQFIEKSNQLGHSTATIRRSFFNDHGKYSHLLVGAGDLDLWVRICTLGEIHIINQPLTAIRGFKNEASLGGRNWASINRGMFEVSVILENLFNRKFLLELKNVFPDIHCEDTMVALEYSFANKLLTHRFNTVRHMAMKRIYQLLSNTENEPSFPNSLTDFTQKTGSVYYNSLKLPMTSILVRNINTKQVIDSYSFKTNFNSVVETELEVPRGARVEITPSSQACLIDHFEVTINNVLAVKKIKLKGSITQMKNGKMISFGDDGRVIIPKKLFDFNENSDLKLKFTPYSDPEQLLSHITSKKY